MQDAGAERGRWIAALVLGIGAVGLALLLAFVPATEPVPEFKRSPGGPTTYSCGSVWHPGGERAADETCGDNLHQRRAQIKVAAWIGAVLVLVALVGLLLTTPNRRRA